LNFFPSEARLGKPATSSSLSRSDPKRAPDRLFWRPLLAIAAAAFAVEIPFFFFGTPSGHDVEFHLYSWLEVLAQWKHGIVYPRWAALAHFAYGEPRFVFYPPGSWTLGALLSAVFPWRIASPVYIWVVLVLAGLSMFALARRCLDSCDATFAAVLYAVNPYHLVIVYWRSAFAELLASCLVPLLLLFVLEAAEGKRRIIAPLGLVLAAAWLTNAPAAVMIHYSLALLIVFFAWKRRSLRFLLLGAGVVALGACLAAFYLLPAIYEQKWVNIAQAVSAGSRPADNFLFIHTTDPDHDAFNRIISWIAALEMAVIVAAGLALSVKRALLPAGLVVPQPSRRESALHTNWRQTQRELWTALLLWAAAACFLMFPLSAVVWKILPKMQFMQFPWRWLLCVSMMFAFVVTSGLRRWWLRAAVCALSIVVIVAAWHRVQAPWWDTAADLREMQDNMATGAGYEGTDEYTPVGADPSAIDKDARKVAVEGPARAVIHVLRWDPESKAFTAELSASDQLVLRLFPYPAWQTEVNGRLVETSTHAGSGQILVPVVAGMNRVEIRFVRTWDRSTGWWISILTAAALAIWSFRVPIGVQESKAA
jgi:hypothetical protein